MSVATDPATLDELCVTSIRTLSMDAVQKANSGHPGTPMALAPLAYVLYARVMEHSPTEPDWPDRDRFVLSCGHASMLLYSSLYLSGYDMPLEELKQFRQLDSKTPGHPEYNHAPGIETTTGPLGQGLSTAVGMALGERMLASRFNRDGHEIVDHYTYVIASDGDLQEGIASEASSLAGHLGLGRLITFWDDNHISIEGDTELSFTEDVGARYEAYGWHVIRLGEDIGLDRLESALAEAREVTDRPSLIVVRTHIAQGSPNKQGTHGAHGAPLGEDEVKLTKEAYGYPSDEPFFVPDEALEHFAPSHGFVLDRLAERSGVPPPPRGRGSPRAPPPQVAVGRVPVLSFPTMDWAAWTIALCRKPLERARAIHGDSRLFIADEFRGVLFLHFIFYFHEEPRAPESSFEGWVGGCIVLPAQGARTPSEVRRVHRDTGPGWLDPTPPQAPCPSNETDPLQCWVVARIACEARAGAKSLPPDLRARSNGCVADLVGSYAVLR
jgi:transketolase N-terminal domain/subunit